MSILADIDLRDRLGPARDQGRRPTCMAMAASAAHESSRRATEYLSSEYLYYHGFHRSHKDPARGLSPVTVTATLDQDGQPKESAWPYLLETPDVAAWKPPSDVGIIHRARLEFSDRTIADVKATLRSATPVLLGIALTLGLYQPDNHGVVRVRTPDTLTARRHAVLAVGLGHDTLGDYILVRGSWGNSWGLNGHAWLQEAYLQTVLETSAVIVS